MVSSRASYLQIVERGSALELARSRRRKLAHQLTLSFSSPDTLMALDASQVSREVLLDMLSQTPPAWLFDLRNSPRLDRIAGNRAQAFALFSSKGVQYVDVFGITGTSSRTTLDRNPISWLPIVHTRLLASDRKRGPFLALFETRNELLNAAPYLADVIAGAVGRKIDLSVAA